jgi:hypothetical protein
MRFIEVLGVLALILAIAWVTLRAGANARRAGARRLGRWRVEPRSGPAGHIEIWLVKGDEQMLFRSLAAAVDEGEVQNALADARARCDTLNGRR